VIVAHFSSFVSLTDANVCHCRAIQGQVDDQDVYCRFGIKWSSTDDDFVVDTLACQAVVKYGNFIKCFLFVNCFFVSARKL